MTTLHTPLNDVALDKIGPKIAVIGVGGAGNNAVDNMLRSGLSGVTFLACNTDAQALSQSLCSPDQRVRLGFGVTKGLGAGSSPDVGRCAAEESIEEVIEKLKDIHMVFVTAGMGGGTGTGGAPVIAKAARERGILTVGVVTKPFHFEGMQRMRAAEKGIEIIKDCVDTLLVIPNQNLFRLANENTTFSQAFSMADDVLLSGVRTFTDLMIKPGLVNLDFADICTVMRNMMGKAMMGTAEARGPRRATEASESAIGGLLLDDVAIRGAKAVLINITGGPDLTLYDVDEAIGRIKQEVDGDGTGRDFAHIIFGATYDETLEGVLRVSVVATGIDNNTPFVMNQPAATLPPLEMEIPDVYTTTLGNQHTDYSFDEKHFSSFGLQEDSLSPSLKTPPINDFSYDRSPPKAPVEAPRKVSFLKRLTRGFRWKDQETVSPQHTSHESLHSIKHEKIISPSMNGIKNFSSEDLDLPAFLRQNNKKKPD